MVPNKNCYMISEDLSGHNPEYHWLYRTSSHTQLCRLSMLLRLLDAFTAAHHVT